MPDEPTNEPIEEAEEVEQPSPQEAPPAEEPASEPEPVEEEEATEEPGTPEETPEETEEKPPSRREQLRIQKLLQRYGPPPERRAPSQRNDALDYETALDADPEVIKQLQDDRRREGEAQYNEGLKRAEFLDWRTSLKIDAPNVEKKYPILDPSNREQFHPGVADAVNNWYLKMSGFDPNSKTVTNSDVSYADFVDGYMELVQETAGQKNAQTAKNIAKQAAATGLRPDGSSAKRLNLNQAPSQMTTEELYAAIGQKPPK
jgi:hypothetical protein